MIYSRIAQHKRYFKNFPKISVHNLFAIKILLILTLVYKTQGYLLLVNLALSSKIFSFSLLSSHSESGFSTVVQIGNSIF